MKFHSKPIEEHTEVPLADDGRWEQLVAHWAQLDAAPGGPVHGKNACYVVSVGVWEDLAQERAQLAEILALVRAQGDRVVGYESYQRGRPDPRTYLGTGTSEAIAARASAAGATLLVVDAELSPSQTRNLEDATGLSVSDREGVILNVFLIHAKSRKARIQVEIAQLEYLRPRIRGIGLDMDQQAGGMMAARGPGETASELLARQLDGRLAELRKQNAKLERAEQTQRKGRESCQRVALVGYTNAGKTSLMNGLTAAELSAKDMPFETLDTTSRSLTRHGGDVVLSDTVGFIRRLPERLLASFETTLAELREASLLAIVVDLSDPEWGMHVDTTQAVLARIGAEAIPRYYVYNKVDRVAQPPTNDELRACSRGHDFTVLSSTDAPAVAQLRTALIDAARQEHRRVRLFVPYRATELTTSIYASCRVIETMAVEHGLVFTIEAASHVIAQIQKAAKAVQA
ncbi:GTP-binding protein HflX [Enhygromyxa salina]|uniref:GTPase HflX n=1 Tax=Enhygromyxa salina TaxID=215803 RepID=A0A0C1ZUV3_9BACT|nr:GTPase HflX [Enhygromyxa salina]KIG14843.1 GTP-binding protein HflX [Enhygromyxa salina]